MLSQKTPAEAKPYRDFYTFERRVQKTGINTALNRKRSGASVGAAGQCLPAVLAPPPVVLGLGDRAARSAPSPAYMPHHTRVPLRLLS